MVANFPQLIVLWSELYRAVHPPVQVMLDPTPVSLTFINSSQNIGKGSTERLRSGALPPHI